MLEKTNKKHKKGFISETDISSLLQKYTANTVLALLQEVAQFPGVKLDWNALVKKTSTGISNAREYQMLWRHLAYRNSLLEKLEDGTRPLDDDSDLEFELEAFPNVNTEASTEAAACVKVLIASGLPSESSLANSSTVEAPLTINIPNGQSHRGSSENPQPSCSMQGMNITVPVSVQKLPLPTTTSTEGLDTNGSTSANMPPRKKRKPWTPEEDIELIAAVQKCGEGNWANILRGDFNWDRTASQLSQRWNILRKKHGTSILGANSTGSQLSEAQLAARHAMSLALDMPVKNITASCANNTAGATSSSTTSSSVLPTANSEALPVGSSVVQAQSHSQQGSIQTKSFPVVLQGPIQTKSSPMVLSGSAAKSRVISKKVLPKSNFTSDLSLKATAVAVGARIGTSSDAASLRAQAKSTIHIMPSGVSSIKSSMTASTPAHLDSHPSVRYIRTGLAATSASTSSAVTSNTSHPGAVKAATPRVQLNASSEQTHAVNSTSATELPLKPEVKAAEEIKVSDSCSVSGNEPSKEVRVDKAALPKPEAELKHEAAPAEMMESDQVHIINQAEGNENGNGDIMMCSTNEEYENQSAVEEKCGLQNSIKKVSELPDMVTDGCSANVEVLSETKAIDEMQG